MGFAKEIRGNNHVLHERRYDRAKVVCDLAKLPLCIEEKPLTAMKNLSRLLLDADTQLHKGAAISIAYTIYHFNKIKHDFDLADRIRAAMIFGGVARNLKDDRLPNDVDVLIIKKDNAEIPTIRGSRRLDIHIYPESFFTEDYLKQDTEQAAFNRNVIVMPFLPLYGEDYLKNLIRVATKYSKLSDVNQFVEAQVRKRRDHLMKKAMENNTKFIEPDPELLKIQTMNDLDINSLVMEMFLSNEFKPDSNTFPNSSTSSTVEEWIPPSQHPENSSDDKSG